jgi:hypothetical protein
MHSCLNEVAEFLKTFDTRMGLYEAPAAPYVPGDTDAERMDNAVRRMFGVSKAEVLKREAEWQRANARKKRAKRNGA